MRAHAVVLVALLLASCDSEKADTAPPDGDADTDTDADGDADVDSDTDADTGTPDCLDADADGLTDADEATAGTDPHDPDSDDDGQSDGAEVALGTNPLDPTARTDGLWVVVPEGCDVEQEVNLDLRIRRVDLAFHVDTSGTVDTLADAMWREFGDIASDLGTVVEDMAYGYATFVDYTCCGWGDPSAGDRPWILQQQVTTDTDLVYEAIRATPANLGSGHPDGVEALYQTATGAGYDMACDGVYDEESDILPFLASSSDPFGGTAGEGYDPSTPGGGTRGGLGFREGALPVLMYGTCLHIRDPDAGDPSPGGCPFDAGSEDLAPALSELGGILLAIDMFGRGDYDGEMTALAVVTDSYGDTDGDGEVDDPLVFEWWGSSTTFLTTVVEGVELALDARTFGRVEVWASGDPRFLHGVDPGAYTDIRPGLAGTQVSFTLTFHGGVPAEEETQTFPITVSVMGDRSVLLATETLSVVVPAASP